MGINFCRRAKKLYPGRWHRLKTGLGQWCAPRIFNRVQAGKQNCCQGLNVLLYWNFENNDGIFSLLSSFRILILFIRSDLDVMILSRPTDVSRMKWWIMWRNLICFNEINSDPTLYLNVIATPFDLLKRLRRHYFSN